MKVFVGIDVIKLKSGGLKGRELGFDLCFELGADLGGKKHSRAGTGHVGAKITAFVDQIRHCRSWQHGLSFNQHQMKPDAQARHGAGALHGVICRRAGHHQTGSGKDSVAMGALYSLIDFHGGAEIIRRDDQPPQIRKRSCLRGS